MKILITGGTGFIGSRLVAKLVKQGHQITILSRRERESDHQLITYRKWDGKEMPLALGLNDIIINLAGASLADSKWTAEYKRLIRDSRVNATKACVEYINACQTPPKLFLSGSAIGFYGGHIDEVVDEQAGPGKDFLGKVCQEWEDAATGANCRTVTLRIGIVLGPEGGPLEAMLPLYRMGLGGRLASGKQGFSWIHLDDLVDAMMFFIRNETTEGPFNLVSPNWAVQEFFSDTLAKVLKKPAFWIVPKFALNVLLGEKGIIVWGGQKVLPRKLDEAGFTFHHPDLEKALADILKKLTPLLMNIAVLSDPANFHTQKWTLALKKEGAKVTLYSFSDVVYPEVTCVKVPPRFLVGGRLNYASYMFTGKRLRTAMERNQTDIVNPINITPFGVWARNSGFRPIAAVSMGADILEYPPTRVHSPLEQTRSWSNIEGANTLSRRIRNRATYHFYTYQVRRALRASTFVTGDNLVLVKAVSDWFHIPPQQVHLNRWGIEPELFEVSASRLSVLREKFGIRQGQKVVLSPRGVKAIYQGDIILEAVANLLRQGRKDAHFIMLSAGYEIPEKVERLARELEGQYTNFHFHRDLLPRTEVYALWPLVDVLISAPVYDGYSNAVGEGRYSGAIPVVNAIPGNLELIRHKENGWIVDPFTPDRLTESLSEVLDQAGPLKKKFRSANREWVLEHACMGNNIRKFLDLCEQALSTHTL